MQEEVIILEFTVIYEYASGRVVFRAEHVLSHDSR